ncbi:MAG: Two-component system-Sensor histidine kinase [Flavipsychrobacter sp.]|jgi:signal transduction histidine kinase|nr:Two-component system-Sensor histidine kinase [Flavipsychrobacter sp.]
MSEILLVSGVAVGIMAILLSISAYQFRKQKRISEELYKHNLELKKQNTSKDRILSAIGHDLLGGMGSMSLALDMYRSDDASDDDKAFLLEQLHKNANTTLETLQNLLNWGKLQIQGIVIKPANINAREKVSELVGLAAVAAESKAISIFNHVPDNLVVLADINHFQFIVRNLLSNAIKYTRTGGQIHISARKSTDEKNIEFSVKDDGVGLREDKKLEIFNSFGISTTGTQHEKGYGIGLRLCKEFVTENGGQIWVESEINKGATFYFSLKCHSHTLD